MTWSISNELRPLRRGDTRVGQPILAGDSAAPPTFLGTLDLAHNTNEMAAHLGMPLVMQVQTSATLSGSTSAQSFAIYRIQPPGIRMTTASNVSLRIQVNATTSGGATFEVRGVTAAETGAWSGATASGSYATAYVDTTTGIAHDTTDGSSDTILKLTLDFKLSGSFDFTPQDISVFPSFSTEDYASSAAAFGTDVIFPQDDEAWDADSPLNVHSVRELVVANNYMFYHTHRHVACWSALADHATLTHDVGLLATAGEREPLTQFIYWPRAGVRRLLVSVTGRVDGHAVSPTDAATVTVGWANGDGEVTGTVDSPNTAWTTWPLSNQFLEVPRGAGPFFLTVYGESATTGTRPLYVQGISIIEVVERALDGVYIGGT